jgi:hypothetical protein
MNIQYELAHFLGALKHHIMQQSYNNFQQKDKAQDLGNISGINPLQVSDQILNALLVL